MTRKRAMPRLAEVTLWMQRHGWLLPRRLRALIGRSGGSSLALLRNSFPVVVDDWSQPLIESTSERAVHDACLPAEMPKPVPAQAVLRPEKSPDLRCLIVTRVLDTGGIDEFVAFLARRLPAYGIAASVMRTVNGRPDRHADGRLASTLRDEGVTVAELSPSDGRQWLAEQRPDVVSAHVPHEWLLDAAHTLHVPVVETLHGIPTPIGTDWNDEPARSRLITSFVAVSDLVRRRYLSGNPTCSRDSIVTIPNGFNDTHRSPVDREAAREALGLDDEFLFVSLARHTLQKNTYGLVAAFSDVAAARSEAHLLIAGRVDDMMYTEQVRGLKDRLPARARIHLRDNSPHPAAVLAAADAFVLDSFFEGWPLATMEALSAGLPVVMSEVGGAREQVGEHGERGYVVPNPLGNPETATWERAGAERFRLQSNRDALAAAMIAVVDGHDRWAAERDVLAADSLQRFDAETCARAHAAVLKHVAAGRSTPCSAVDSLQ
jgi:glycosyltransferase involved in cell wall biosynthesis